jgi:hypothetical protein
MHDDQTTTTTTAYVAPCIMTEQTKLITANKASVYTLQHKNNQIDGLLDCSSGDIHGPCTI